MANYTSALEQHLKPGLYGQLVKDKPSIILTEIDGLYLTQISFFAAEKTATHKFLTERFGCGLPQAGSVSQGKSGRRTIHLARLDPFRVLIISQESPIDLPEKTYPLDFSDARTVLQISGSAAEKTLSRLCALDFRDAAFPEGAFATTGMHHIGVSVWRHKDGYRLFIPRSFAASLYHLIFQISEQFGCEVKGND